MPRGDRFQAAASFVLPLVLTFATACELIAGIHDKQLEQGGGADGGASAGGGGAGPSTSTVTSTSTGMMCASQESFSDSTPFCSDGLQQVDCDDPRAVPGQDGLHVGIVASYTPIAGTQWVTDDAPGSGLVWAEPTVVVNGALDDEFTDDLCPVTPDRGDKPQVPAFVALVSLLDFGLDGSAFPAVFEVPSVAQGNVVTHDQHAGPPAQTVIASSTGQVGQANDPFNVRCVIGDLVPKIDPDSRMLDNAGNDSVFDTMTGLTWQLSLGDHPPNIDFTEAVAYCAERSAPAGVCPWRVPSVKELLTLVGDDGLLHPAFAGDGSGVDPRIQEYFSSTFYRDNAAQFWTVAFGSGVNELHTFPNATGAFVRCVR